MAQDKTFDVVIPALNEELNISNIISSVFSQVTEYTLNEVVIISDGSDDHTNDIVTNLLPLYRKLKLIKFKKRKGKTQRMIEAFEKSTASALILLDADTLLGNKYSLNNLLRPIFLQGKDLTSGKTIKMQKSGLMDKIMSVSDFLQDKIKREIRSGDNVYACHGRIVALSNALYSTIRLPASSVGNDAYLYFFNKFEGSGRFEYVESATSCYAAPQSTTDYAKQQRRFSTTPQELAKFFGDKIYKEYKIPLLLKIRIAIICLFKYHYTFILYVVIRLTNGRFTIKNSVSWDVSQSTKKL